jgi:hypothetical protein
VLLFLYVLSSEFYSCKIKTFRKLDWAWRRKQNPASQKFEYYNYKPLTINSEEKEQLDIVTPNRLSYIDLKYSQSRINSAITRILNRHQATNEH